MSLTNTHAMFNTHREPDPQEGPQSTYAFLVHSQVSLAHNVLPVIKNDMITRQKRRRTSPEDHAILEAAYQRNSKPDKAERTATVNRVSLGEKEVQIWFQNRRQNDRRKSKPLQPSEMVPHFRNSIPQELLQQSIPTSLDTVSSPQTSFSSFDGFEQIRSSSSNRCDDRSKNASRASSIQDLLNPMSPPDSYPSTSSDSHNADQASTQISHSNTEPKEAAANAPLVDCPARSATASPRSNKLGNGDSSKQLVDMPGQLTPAESSNAIQPPHPVPQHGAALANKVSSGHLSCIDPSSTCRKRIFDEMEEPALPFSQSSEIRLSMTLDGAVKVKTAGQETPSPPKRPRQNAASLRKDGLRRSHSAVAASELLKDKSAPNSGTFGKGRDARTWEFYCDGDARAALSPRVVNGNSGSAVRAINLMRYQNRNAKPKAQQRGRDTILKPKLGAENMRKQAVATEQKPKLVRAMSSMARLSSTAEGAIAEVNKTGKTTHVRSPSGDSDKENWIPGTTSCIHPLRRPQPSGSTSRIAVQDGPHGARSQVIGLRQSHGKDKHPNHGREDGVSEHGGFQGHSFTDGEDKEGDMDCVQGLLSLSQGAWK